MNNRNFKNVKLYRRNDICMNDVLLAKHTQHFDERADRLALVALLDKNPKIDKMFLVDKGHKNGLELHVVTTNGIIYILNYYKFLTHDKALVTVLVARPNQVARLYSECHLKVNNLIINKCIEHQQYGFNNC